MTITKEQEAAVRKFMLARGGLWKRDLRVYWSNDAAPAILQAMHTTHGEEWLAAYNGNVIRS